MDGNWRTTFTGDFHLRLRLATGTLLGFAQTTPAGRYSKRPESSAYAADRLRASWPSGTTTAFSPTRSPATTASLGSGRGDYLIGFGGEDILRGGAGNDQLFGGSDRDTIDGGAGEDFLAGGLDLDLMRGGSGSDTYLVAQAGDRVVEAGDAGADTILSTVSTTIAANVERLVLIGNAAIDGRGGAGDDAIDGNEAANRLTGGAGRTRSTATAVRTPSKAASAATSSPAAAATTSSASAPPAKPTATASPISRPATTGSISR